MARMLPGTSTLLMRFPTTSRSRSRRMTSTSGSSGIVAPDSVGLSVDRAGDGRLFRRVRGVLDRQRRPRGVRGHLFGSFLGPTFTLAARLPVDEHDGEEVLRVIGTFVAHLVSRQPLESARRELLKQALVVP